MPRRLRSPLGCVVRLVVALAAYAFAALIAAGGERWNRTWLLVVLLVAQGCAAAAPKPRVVPVDNRPHVCPATECVAAVE